MCTHISFYSATILQNFSNKNLVHKWEMHWSVLQGHLILPYALGLHAEMVQRTALSKSIMGMSLEMKSSPSTWFVFMKTQGRNVLKSSSLEKVKLLWDCIVLILRIETPWHWDSLHISPSGVAIQKLQTTLWHTYTNCIGSYAMYFRYLPSSDISSPNSHFSCFKELIYFCIWRL